MQRDRSDGQAWDVAGAGSAATHCRIGRQHPEPRRLPDRAVPGPTTAFAGACARTRDATFPTGLRQRWQDGVHPWNTQASQVAPSTLYFDRLQLHAVQMNVTLIRSRAVDVPASVDDEPAGRGASASFVTVDGADDDDDAADG